MEHSSQNPTPNYGDLQKLTECNDIMSTLPRNYCLSKSHYVRQYQGFWFSEEILPQIMSVQRHFQANSTNILLATSLKTGTTWLKALTFAVVTRNRFDDSNNPLLGKLPHDLCPALETNFVGDPEIPLISTHLPYTSLPKSVLQKQYKVIYLWRDAKDRFVSSWFFLRKLLESRNFDTTELLSLEEEFEQYCQGVSHYGPYWDHILSYWKVKLENPDKILFLKYEEMMEDTAFHVKKIAEFVGYPFTIEEEEQGAVQKITKMCSFEKLSSLDVNKSGVCYRNSVEIENKAFFRKGKVGDWSNYLTEVMGARLDSIMEDKLKGCGLKI